MRYGSLLSQGRRVGSGQRRRPCFRTAILNSTSPRRHRPSGAISDIARMFPDQAPSPSRPEQVTPLGIFFVEIKGIDDAVGSKAAKITAQFAPCRQYPHRFVIADRDRPDRAFAVAAVFVAIAQRDFPSFVNLRTRPR